MYLLTHVLGRDCWLTNPFHLRLSLRKHTQSKALRNKQRNQSITPLSVQHEICLQKHLHCGAPRLRRPFPVQTDSLGGGGWCLRQMLGTLKPVAISRWLTAARLSLSDRSCSFPKVCPSLTIGNRWENKYCLRVVLHHPASWGMKMPLQMNANVKRKLWLSVLSLVFNHLYFNHFVYKSFVKMNPIFTWLAKEIRLCGKLNPIYLTVF